MTGHSINPPPGVYARTGKPLPLRPGRQALFLDRDGVINEDVGYLHKIEDLIIRPGIALRIGEARRAGLETVIITNQSGIGRGYYGWPEFEAVQREVIARLRDMDAQAEIGLTCACPFHADARPPYRHPDHPWRKPNAGMIEFAAVRLGLDLQNSVMIGDSASDEEAARRAGVAFEYA